MAPLQFKITVVNNGYIVRIIKDGMSVLKSQYGSILVFQELDQLMEWMEEFVRRNN